MGLLFSRILIALRLRQDVQYKLLILGLDGAGKTTLLYWLRLRTTVVTIPTIGLNVEEVHLPNTGLKFVAWDIGGQEKLRTLWSRFYKDTKGVIYVVDSSDCTRLQTAKDELFKILKDPQLKNIPCLLLANKQDLPGARNPAEIEQQFDLAGLFEMGHECFLRPTIATTGEGLLSAFEQFGVLVRTFIKGNKR